jgi:putative CocE/NonD family hydrolase
MRSGVRGFLTALAALFLALPGLALPGLAAAQGVDWVKSNYEKKEISIPMRDGTKLFTIIYAPRDKSKTYPFLMMRTPYGIGPYGPAAIRDSLGPNPTYGPDGYIFVYQDVRGRYMSEGTYAYMTPHLEKKSGPKDVDESTDSYDTIDWLVKNVKGSNGRVGLYGISAPGFFVAASMIDAHPALKAASPQAPLIDWYMGDDRHHNGALMLAQTFNFLNGFDIQRKGPIPTYDPKFEPGTNDGYRFFLDMGPVKNSNSCCFKDTRLFWNQILDHDTYDAYWQARSLQGHLKDIKPAVLFVGGWYDGEDPMGPLEGNRAMTTQSPKTQTTLVVGPWWHGQWSRGDGDSIGAISFGQKTSVYYREQIEQPFFACHLKDVCGQPLPRAIVFEAGANQWRTFDAWPPKAAVKKSLYLQPGFGLGFQPPAKAGEGYDAYVSDPAKPVPYTKANSFGYWRNYPIEDQRFASQRPDVLTYQTEALKTPLTLAGPIRVKLKASTSGTDADYIVKVIDVYPDDFAEPLGDTPAKTQGVRLDGYQQLIRGDVMRAKFRKSFSAPVAMKPNQPDDVEFTIQDVFHTLKPGHRLMVQVQSTWFPLVDRNPQTFTQINKADASAFKTATMRIYREPQMASSLELTVLP